MKTTKVTTLFITAVAISAAFASSAKAQCGFSPRHNLTALALQMPSLGAHPMVQDAAPQNGEEPTIVGLWDVKFISENQLFDEGFDQYHSDGTEILNDTPPPVGGNVCLGIWAKTGPRSLKLKHPFWIFDPATNTTVIGRGVLLEQITLDRRGNSFRGTFKFEFRDLSGNPIPSMPDVSGNLTADRITVD